MDTSQINRELRKYSEFVGTFPCDKIPNTTKRPAAFVINTDPHYREGEHWVAMFLKEKSADYFDSFGLPPLQHPFKEYILKHANNNYKYNNVVLQHPDSKACGTFCIQFLKHRIKGKKYKNFINQFCLLNLKINDTIVINKK